MAAPLLVLGAPVALALETPASRRRAGACCARGSAPVRAITQPVATFLLLFVGLLAYFLTPALGDSMSHVWLLNLVNLGFLAAALLFWSTMVGAETSPARKLAILAGALVVRVGPRYRPGHQSKTVAADLHPAGTHAGGAILWVVAMLATFTAMIAVYHEWSRSELRSDAADIPSLADATGFGPVVATRVSRRRSPPGGAVGP